MLRRHAHGLASARGLRAEEFFERLHRASRCEACALMMRVD
jgi:hypothetical protein